MSKRTAEANTAINQAWENERELVYEGKGTRDWTPEQQIDILQKGKAYDENGNAFEGHHMKSVEAYPEAQGDPGNIQFLSRAEHQDAHYGNFQNPTNGYYNPESGATTSFNEDSLTPASQGQLSEPVLEEEDDFDYADTGEEIDTFVESSESINNLESLEGSDDMEM